MSTVPTRPTKHQVRAAFDRAARTYDAAAELQRQAVTGLLARLSTVTPCLAAHGAPLLDAGCGTGYALPLLARQFPRAPLVAADLAPAMVEAAQAVLAGVSGVSELPGKQAAAPQALCADLEALPLADASLGLYWSSLALQWCHLPHALGEARRLLRPGGTLAIATLGPGTFAELAQAFACVDRHRHVLAFDDANVLTATLADAGFAEVRLDSETLTVHYPDLRSLLAAIKAVGANQVGPGRRTVPLGRAGLARLAEAYEPFRTPAGLPLSYRVIYALARS
ncbi:biotin synthesis protein [Oryzomicrobium terrae]|uniref:Malonyl-[acyl-carrier protein] O-methyltransferase n=1 Tax=Oryzomicrobium terrae TaxID=1735038 RepID=A0A5C1E8B0_9RHOO|nr:malonyl-ACP O-methyltransferase BioC [Oryzomicrobium terrae]QEL65191.1 biotin synthesis protein [Oryzomicrobium terrae]